MVSSSAYRESIGKTASGESEHRSHVASVIIECHYRASSRVSAENFNVVTFLGTDLPDAWGQCLSLLNK